jgi:hypothetical protein
VTVTIFVGCLIWPVRREAQWHRTVLGRDIGVRLLSALLGRAGALSFWDEYTSPNDVAKAQHIDANGYLLGPVAFRSSVGTTSVPMEPVASTSLRALSSSNAIADGNVAAGCGGRIRRRILVEASG